MKNNQRNLLFLLLTSITFGAALGLYLRIDKDTREEDLWMGLMITGGVLLAGFLALMAYDSFSGNEEQYDEQSRKEVLNERMRNRTLSQQHVLTEEEIGKHVMHTHYAFENWRNSWRSVFIAIVHVVILSSLIVFYVKSGTANADTIVALTFGVLALAIHVGFLLYSLYAQYYFKEYRNPIEMVRDRQNIVN
jgi:Na+/melibiose symporter-like transporter